MRRCASPPGDPREARSLAETASLPKDATPQQLQAFWHRFGGAAHGELARVGPVVPQQVFGGWASAEPHQPWFFEYAPELKSRWEEIQVPEKADASDSARIPLAMNEEFANFPANPQAEGAAGAINITASFAPENRDRLRADWLAQPANLAGLLANNLRWGRDMGWFAHLTDACANLDAQAVNAALARYLDLDRLTEVAAGSFH